MCCSEGDISTDVKLVNFDGHETMASGRLRSLSRLSPFAMSGSPAHFSGEFDVLGIVFNLVVC